MSGLRRRRNGGPTFRAECDGPQIHVQRGRDKEVFIENRWSTRQDSLARPDSSGHEAKMAFEAPRALGAIEPRGLNARAVCSLFGLF
jgi:hypothetical protein